MEENKLIESKKILTDYMLELNNDIQRAEDWVNTGVDEEMYFALKTVLNELERLQKEFEAVDHECSRLERKEIELENKKCLHCGNDTPLYCENCYQELISKNAELQLENEHSVIATKLAIMQKQIDDSIPKQVIRDKIKELEQAGTESDKYYFDYQSNLYDFIAGMKKSLKELLGE